MHLSGQLSDWSINDLLQIMEVTKKTGSLDIEGERRGRVHFSAGAVTGAELTGAKGSYLGGDRGGIADVLYVLSSLTEGVFSIGAADGPENSGWPVTELLADVEALQSLEGEVIDAGLFEASGVRLAQEIDEPLEISPKDWAILVSLVQPFTFGHLEGRLGRGGAVRLFHTLHRLGVAEVMLDDDHESAWLDRLAADVTPESPDPASTEAVDQEEPDSGSEDTEDSPLADEDRPEHSERVLGVSAPASTMLTNGVYDEIRRLRSKVSEK